MKEYLLKLLKRVVEEKTWIKDNFNDITNSQQAKYKYFLAQEEILVRILNERFGQGSIPLYLDKLLK